MMILPQIREVGTSKKEKSKINKSIFSSNPHLKEIGDASLNSVEVR